MIELSLLIAVSAATAIICNIVFTAVVNHYRHKKMVGELRRFSERCSEVSFIFLTKHYYNPTAIERTVDNWTNTTYRLDRRLGVDIYK